MNVLLQKFQTILNDALKAGRKPRGRDYQYTEYRRVESVLAKVCFKLNKESGHLFSITQILFDTDSGFLDMIEWKQDDPLFEPHSLIQDKITIETWGHNNNALYHRHVHTYIKQDKSYHAMMLAAIIQDGRLSVDEARIQYVLDNMKGFISKTTSGETPKELTE